MTTETIETAALVPDIKPVPSKARAPLGVASLVLGDGVTVKAVGVVYGLEHTIRGDDFEAQVFLDHYNQRLRVLEYRADDVTGMVLALQSYTGFTRFNAEGAVAGVVVLSVTRELAPVLAGLMVAGRVGAAIAAEIGTMRVTEQIDALRTLSVNPFKYLIAPRVIAGTLMLPLLVLVGDIIGVFGGYIVSIYNLGFSPGNYLTQTWDILERIDVVSGLWKAGVFGLIVSLMGCYHGFSSGRGAQGVGNATTHAVVSASILILIVNYIMTQVFFS